MVVFFINYHYKVSIGTPTSCGETVLLRAGCAGWQATMTT